MKLALVTCFNADWHRGRVPSPYLPLNLLGLAASLRDGGHDVAIIDQTLAMTHSRVADGPGFHDDMAHLIHAA